MALSHLLACYCLICFIQISLELADFVAQHKKHLALLLLKDTTKSKLNTYNISVINLSSIELSEKESSQLSLGLDHSYITRHITRAETFPDFMYQTFKNNEHYKNMSPSSNQPAKFYRTAKLTSLKTLMKSACNLYNSDLSQHK